MRTIGCALALMICTGVASAEDTLHVEEGTWKVTRLISLGSSHELTKPAPTSECLSTAHPLPAAEVGWPAGTTCTSENTVSGSGTAWTFTCVNGTTTTTGTGTVTYKQKSFSGTLKVKTVTQDAAGESGRLGLLKISGTFVGKRPAACPQPK